MADKKTNAPAPDPTYRPDPVGERNYALGAPQVRPEGEGTPGAMHSHAVPAAKVQGAPLVPPTPVAAPGHRPVVLQKPTAAKDGGEAHALPDVHEVKGSSGRSKSGRGDE